MASAQSLALRTVPGYSTKPTAAPTTTVAYPTLPTLPSVPALAGDATLPNYVGRQLIANQLGQLGTQQSNDFSLAQAGAKQALAGYGGWYFNQDDPSTAYREDLQAQYDAKRGPGARDKAAYQQARGQGAAAGITEGVIATQNIAQAVQRVSLEAQAVVNQYAAQINSIATNYANQGSALVTQYAGLYGADSQWALDHPPPPPAPTMAPGGTTSGVLWSGYFTPDADELRKMYPGVPFVMQTEGDGRVVVTAVPQTAAAPVTPTRLATPNSPAGSYPTWTGSAPPNLQSLAKQWGVPVSAIRVTPLANGKFTAWAQAAPPGPGAGAFG